MHFAAAMEYHLDQSLEFEHPGHAGDCGVLAHRMPAGDRALDKGALLAHLGHLRGSHSRHGDLGELRQIQHALGMLIVHAGGDQTRRVVAHHVQHRKAEGLPGELVGAIPHLARRLRAGTDLHTHALVLNTLTREGIGGFRGG